MGEVYRARDTRLGRIVALKILPAHRSDERARERFDREAKAISTLADPHICALYDVGHHEGTDYLVMEYLEGRTLAEAIARGPLPRAEAIRYAAEIAGALSEAHRHGIVHRDLKPGNIMLTRTGAKVLDFGLARAETRDGASSADAPTQRLPLTEEGTIVGTVQYMAPEQLECRETDARSDIFALGTILYEMLTGRRAFESTTRAGLVAAILEREPPSLPESHPPLDSIVRRCLAKSPNDRFQSARDLQLTLQELSASGPAPAIARESKRRWWPAAVALAVVIVAAGGWFLLQRRAAGGGLALARTVAVLPFASLGVDSAHDYLRLAIADEITTILSAQRGLSVRPFALSRRFTGDSDPRTAARDLNAAGIVSGNLRSEGDRLFVTVEVVDVRDNRLFWRDRFDIASGDLLTMRNELASRIRNGLMPLLAGEHDRAEASRPKDSAAYSLYLRSTALSSDAGPNSEALRLLQEAVRLDSGYAPAWAALSKRYYYSYTYGGAGVDAHARAIESAQRALELDRDLVLAATSLIVMRTETGETQEAWKEATNLVARRPDSVDARVALSYVLRYGGALEQSAAECERAWAIDSGHRAIRSCSLTFLMLENYVRTRDFLHLEHETGFAGSVRGSMLLVQGHSEEALRLLPQTQRDLLAAALGNSQPAFAAELARMRSHLAERGDGEPFYVTATHLSYAGRTGEAIDALASAIRLNFCGYPAIDREPLLANARKDPRWLQVRASAAACHERFMKAIGEGVRSEPQAQAQRVHPR
jgi:TolB-like protein